MIERLTIQNFQCVEEFDETLDPGINCFVGRSGRGKTSRAIRAPFWLVFNKPTGNRFLYDEKITGRKWDGKPTIVSMRTSDGHYVGRIRSANSNLYLLDDQTFQGFGQSVPEEVTKSLNLHPVNFQLQHARRVEDERFSQCNPLYLLSMSPSEVARILNDLGGIDDIDDALSYVNKRMNREDALKKSGKLSIEKIEGELVAYSGLDSLDKAVSELEGKEREIEELDLKIRGATEAVNSVKIKKAALSTFKGLKRFKASVDRLGVEQAKIDALSGELTVVYDAVHRLKEARKGQDALALLYQNAKEKFEKAKPKTCPLCGGEWKKGGGMVSV